MAFEKARKHLEAFGLAERIIVPEHGSATVAEAAEAGGCGRARKGILLLGGTLPARRGRIKRFAFTILFQRVSKKLLCVQRMSVPASP